MNKIRLAELILSMTTDYLSGKIDDNLYYDNLKMMIDKVELSR